LTTSLTATEKKGRLGAAIELRILRSLALLRQGRSREAEADLERTLTQAQPEGYVRVFLDEGRPMQMLLSQWLARAGAGPLQDYARHLLAQFEAETQELQTPQGIASPAAELVEPLSRRELEVLHLVAQGKTNKEIAQQLIVAPGTVKAHTASIYRKLDVANRTEAAARARQLGLLP
jgi:LuxR family maltose regulon positive regulatory protein